MEIKMKNRILKVVGGATMAIAVLACFTQVWVSAQVQREPGLIGSWDVQVTARDCETGAPIPFIPVFPAVLTYNQGGTMDETDLGGPGIVRLPGHGVWQHQTGRQYSAAYRWLNFLPDRTFIGSNVVRSSVNVSLGGDSYTSTYTLEILNPNGDVIATGCATTVATRFQ
jgi:hypothetical protein